mgnify:CR=1 FL=1
MSPSAPGPRMVADNHIGGTLSLGLLGDIISNTLSRVIQNLPSGLLDPIFDSGT